jgi:drug/metabolite transporter (DMT)-like permease
LVQRGIEGIPTVSFVQTRFLVAALILFPIAWGRWGLRGAVPARSVAPGLLLAVGFILQTEGLRTVRPSVSAFLTATSVIMVPILTAVLGWERTNRRCWIAAVLALGGVFLLQGMRLPAAWSRGETWTFLCAAVFAGQIVVLGRLARTEEAPLRLASGQVTVAAVVLSLLGAIRGEHFFGSFMTTSGWIAAVFTGIPATAVAFFVQTWAQRRAPAGHVAVCFSSEPVFATGFAIAFFGDRMASLDWIGSLAVLAATVIVVTESSPEGGRGRGGSCGPPTRSDPGTPASAHPR